MRDGRDGSTTLYPEGTGMIAVSLRRSGRAIVTTDAGPGGVGFRRSFSISQMGSQRREAH